MIADLLDAQTLLGANYPTAERTRVNNAAATALLARVYLYTQQWSKAETEATKVITDTKYSLLSDLNSVFLKNSNEAIWQLQTVNTSTAGVNTWEGFSIVPANATTAPLYKFYPNFMATFEANDKRKAAWTKTFTNTSGTIDYPVKYKVRTGTPVTEYSMTLRFAELFLIRAEARAQQDKLDLAIADLTTIRSRAGLLALPLLMTKAEVLAAVEKERKLELFGEWGHRWFDLKRTGRAMAVLTPIKPTLAITDLLYPIPLAALNTNPNLVPNP
jgi:hypothetical protein